MLDLRGVSRSFGALRALDDMSFRVGRGEICGFVGRNGAGKTTAMRIILGLLQADAGEVDWNGRPVDSAMRRRFGYMPEERGLYPKMRVGQHLVYLGRLHGLDGAAARAATARVMERLGVAGRADDRIEQLSLGNQQRVQLAAALVHEPDLLVLDEPFSGLDPVGVDALAAEIRARADLGVPVLFSSHQLDLVERMCETVAIIDAGRVLASGPIETLRVGAAMPPRVRVSVDTGNDAWADGLAGVTVVERSGGGVVLELTRGVTPDAVLDAARGAGSVTHFELVRLSLAEMFRQAVPG